jgi:hypothetical protein
MATRAGYLDFSLSGFQEFKWGKRNQPKAAVDETVAAWLVH